MEQNNNTDILPYASCLYRFQGGIAPKRIVVEGKNKIIIPNEDAYTYLSKHEDHHKYFAKRKIKQVITRISKSEEFDLYNYNNVRYQDYRNLLEDILTYSLEYGSFESIKFFVEPSFINLLEDNYIYPKENVITCKFVNRVDKTIKEGGYGIADEWQNLFKLLTLGHQVQIISIDEIIFMIKKMNYSCRDTNKIMSFLDKNNTQFEINEKILSTFTKCEIKDSMQLIIDRKLYKEGSTLDTNPSLVINQTIENYEIQRIRTLKKYKG